MPTRPRAEPKPLPPSRRAGGEIPPVLLTGLRAICLSLPEAYEEAAWVGTRFMIRKRNFAHLVPIDRGFPPAYARAAGSDGPLVVLTFRTSYLLYDSFRDSGPRFFQAIWGTRWGSKVVGLKLGKRVNFGEIEALVVESYRLLAPKRLVESAAFLRRGLIK